MTEVAMRLKGLYRSTRTRGVKFQKQQSYNCKLCSRHCHRTFR